MSVVRAYRFSPLQTFTLCVWVCLHFRARIRGRRGERRKMG